MRPLLFCALPLLGFLPASVALADPMTYDINFMASGTVTASGSYTLAFDPTVAYTDATAGLIVNSFSDTFTPPADVGFDYDVQDDTLVIGGLQSGVDRTTSGTDDYFVVFSGVTAPNPSFGVFGVTTASNSSIFFSDYSGTVTIADAAATPEPGSLLLAGTGVLALLGAARRRLL